MSKSAGLAVGILAALMTAGPMVALAHPGGGGGGHGGGGGRAAGGGHAGGGGHAAAAPHFGGGGGSGGGAHFAAASHYAGGGARAYGGRVSAYGGVSHGYAGGAARGYGGAYRGAAYGAGYRGAGYGGAYRGAAYGGRGYAGGYYHGGYGGFHGYSTGAYWRGGYWRGGFWPRAYYGPGFSWFLAALPLAYATYWYSGIPYYYANDVYYTWSPDYSGYVATDPPPVADSSGAGPTAAAPPVDGQYPGAGAPLNQPIAQAEAPRMFMYPKNGQNDEQQRTDKLDCEKWASDQVGLGTNGPDYQRALGACIQGRGYSIN